MRAHKTVRIQATQLQSGKFLSLSSIGLGRFVCRSSEPIAEAYPGVEERYRVLIIELKLMQPASCIEIPYPSLADWRQR
jgi:hypothetical protein